MRDPCNPSAGLCRQSNVWSTKARGHARLRWAEQSEQASIWIAVNVNCGEKIRPLSLLGCIAFLGLACCVFGWGLQYKLSLYGSSQPTSHLLPSVKLISGDEQSRTPESLLAVQIEPVTPPPRLTATIGFLVSFLAVSLLTPAVSGHRESDALRPRHLGRGILTLFFVRPPPALA